MYFFLIKRSDSLVEVTKLCVNVICNSSISPSPQPVIIIIIIIIMNYR